MIHQIWIQGALHLPKRYDTNIAKIKTLHADYGYMLWDEIAIINLMRRDPLWLDTYYRLTFLHQKIDFAKYVILYKYGGIYIDMDVTMIKSFTSLLEFYQNSTLIVSRLNLDSFSCRINCGSIICINNGIIMSAPSERIIEEMINHVHKSSNYNTFIKYNCINNTTGPKIFTRVVRKYMHNNVAVLEPEYFEPLVLGIGQITRNTYAIHQQDGTWLGKYTRNIGYIYMKYRQYIIAIILITLSLIFVFLTRNKQSGK